MGGWFGWLVGLLVGWLVRWLVRWFVGWLFNNFLVQESAEMRKPEKLQNTFPYTLSP